MVVRKNPQLHYGRSKRVCTPFMFIVVQLILFVIMFFIVALPCITSTHKNTRQNDHQLIIPQSNAPQVAVESAVVQDPQLRASAKHDKFIKLKEDDIPIIQDQELVDNFVVMITSGKRPGNAFYLKPTLEALWHKAKVRPEQVVLFNVEESGKHTLLEEYYENTLKTEFPVNLISRAEFESIVFEPAINIETPIARDKKWQYDMAAGDDEKRKQWRTKEALDFMFVSRKSLTMYPSTQWFIYLQDDAEYTRSRSLHEEFQSIKTMYAGGFGHLNKHGNVALIFHREVLEGFLGYAALRYHKIPIDWLLENFYTSMKIYNPVSRYFNHIGKQSSFSKNEERTQV